MNLSLDLIKQKVRETATWIQPICGTFVVEQDERICACAVGLLAIEAGFLYSHPDRDGAFYGGVMEYLMGLGMEGTDLYSLSNGWEGWCVTKAQAQGTDPLWNLGNALRRELQPERFDVAALRD